LPSIASFKTSSNKDNSESKYKKKTDLLEIPDKSKSIFIYNIVTNEMLENILDKIDSRKKKILNESLDSV
jgi:hypothetical protein